MERQFNNGDFEKLLRDNANQYKMYPSEKVWKGVHSALHSRRNWYGITALALLLLTGTGVSLFLFNNNKIRQSNLNTDTAVITKSSPAISNNFVDPVTVSDNVNSSIPYTKKTDKDYLEKTTRLLPVYIDLEKESITSDFVEKTITLSPVAEAVKETIEKKINNNETKAETGVIETSETNSGIVNSLQQENNENLISEKSDIINAEEFNKEKTAEEKLKEAINALESQNATIPARKKTPKITAQVYFTPTVSYRTLTENKRSYTNGLFVNTQVVDLNKEVKHKPAMGLEFGIEGKYRVNERFFIKTGFQFNINRYDIRAYSHPTEIATVAINSGFGTDSMASLSNYRNKGGAYANWLENFYFQAAIPVGAEIILTERKNFSWGIGGTIQPTYVIGDRAYLISSDYKNYAKFPDLMRRWNLSTSIETFVGYSTGKIKWQVGPNMRYQHLSSFISEYPVKENLFAIGLKVGATFNYKK